MAHPLVDQLGFTRSEWQRGLRGLAERDGAKHYGQMNSIGWIVGHLTWQEQRYLLHRPQGIMPRPDIQAEFASGGPMSTPSLKAMLAAWRKMTRATEDFLDGLTTADLLVDLPLDGKRTGQTLGSAIRQMLGQRRLPQYVGNTEGQAPYRPEVSSGASPRARRSPRARGATTRRSRAARRAS